MKFKNLKEKNRYYQNLADHYLLPNSFILCHIDGRSFSKMVKNKFKKPFDDIFVDAMNKTAQYLCEEVQGCKLAYTQSDEISLLLTDLNNDGQGDMFFAGRLCKMQSIIAALATAKFNQIMMANRMKEKGCTLDTVLNAPLYQFDCKCWNVPSMNEAYAWFLFRQIDCVRNSKQQVCQTYLPHKTLTGLNTDEQCALLLKEQGIDWNAFIPDVKYGRFITREMRHEKKFIEKFGKEIEFDRNAWVVKPGYELTKDGAKKNFYDMLEAETFANQLTLGKDEDITLSD